MKLRYVVIAALIVGLGVGGYLWYTKEKPPISAGNVTTHPAISEHSPLVPEPAKKQGGILKVRIKPKPTVTNPMPEEQEVTVYIPRNPREESPIASVDTGATVTLDWTPIRAAFLDLFLSLHGGVSVDMDRRLSPFVGASLLEIAGTARFGGGADLSGCGPFAAWELAPNLELAGMWRMLTFRESQSVAVGITYRF